MFLKSIFEKIKSGLSRTRQAFSEKIKNIFSKKLDENLINEIEELLISADVSVSSTQKIIQKLNEAWKKGELKDTNQLKDYLKKTIVEILTFKAEDSKIDSKPFVIMFVGVNGTGKTTSIAKLASMYKRENKGVILSASDTFRAAAIEQLEIWSKRAGVEIVKGNPGADPASVAFDAAQASISRNADVLIVDTAGRLHTKVNLMKELSKIKNVLQKKIASAPHEVLLVLDATTGQNAIQQSKIFKEAVDVTGIFLAKLDGTAKGGIVISIADEMKIPVKYVGIGEKLEDIEKFDPVAFVEALFETSD